SSHPLANPKRTMISFASPDFSKWEESTIVSFHRPEPQPEFNVGRQVHLGASIWHRRNVLLGLYGAWQGPATNQTADVRMNLGLIISNDGAIFREPVADFPFIRFGAEESDWKTVRLLQGSAFVNHGDKTYIWYGGAVGDHKAIEHDCDVGLATFPRDRFGYLYPRKPGANWTSRSLAETAGGVELAINAQGIGENSHIEVDILDHQFVPVPGLSGDSAGRVKRSGLRELVSWGDKYAVALDKPWRIRARFVGEEAEATNMRFYSLY